MTKQRTQRYDLYINTPATGLIKAAEVVLLETSGLLTQMAFRYTEAYREYPNAFPLDPVQLPLIAGEFNLFCSGGMPGILDDYLPDAWGRKVLAKLAFYREKRILNERSAIDTLEQLSNSRIGAIQWVKPESEPDYSMGCDIKHLLDAESVAQSVDTLEPFSEHLDEISLLYLANAGTGVGGARPKALISEPGRAYLAKFNKLSQDTYNNAKVELACLLMANKAGLDVYGGHVQDNVNSRDVLLLDRFDVITNDDDKPSRRHLITINSLLKDKDTQRDKGGAFRYDDIADIVRTHSSNIKSDLTQLLRIMLFNRAINNIDDHERNFSMINEGNGYCLAPAYDIVPSLTTGVYPVAGYKYTPWTPKPSEITAHGKVFGLPKTVISRIADQVITAVAQWPDIAEECRVSDKDNEAIKKVITF